METQRAAAFRRVTALLRSKRCGVAMVGPSARTWFVDIAQINEIVEYLTELGATIRISGKLPFDGRVEEAAFMADAAVECVGPLDLEQRLVMVTRNDAVLEGTDLVVAFPLQGGDVTTADPLIETAIIVGIPVLAVYRDETVKLVVDEATYLYV